ncbi:MAG: hypothetical protein OEY11_15235 [Gammaproteobacteria bacterium]|nr:hypothetical protein [Gammaproteobacteria bacterium]
MSYATEQWHDKHGPPKPFVLSGSNNHRYVTVDNLNKEKKQLLWQSIKNKKPALAELLQDETFLQFKKQFGAVQKIEQITYNELVKD